MDGRRSRLAAFLLLAAAATSCEKDDQPTYGDALARSIREGKGMDARGDLQAIANAVTNYVSSGNELPQVNTVDQLAEVLQPTHIRRVPRHDPWGGAYHYESDGSSYTLTCDGKDRKYGTKDDIEISDGQVTKMPKSYTTYNGE